MKSEIKILPEKKYQWNPDFVGPLAHTDINLVLNEIKIIEEVHGMITPQLIVDSAKNGKSILHGYFEWNDAKAANSWRLRLATRLISNIQVITISDGKPKSVIAFISSKKSFGGQGNDGYQRIDEATPHSILLLKKRCVGDLVRVQNRISQFKECREAVELISKAIQAIQAKTEPPTSESSVVTTGNKTELLLADKVS